MRFGTVALVGRTNVGKSTFLNQALRENLAITSPRPQTTRDALLGIAYHEDAQMAFVDTPGVHRPRTELGKRMNNAAFDSIRGADAVLMMTDAWTQAPATPPSTWMGEPQPSQSPWIRSGDNEVLARIKQLSRAPVVLAINKADTCKDKGRLLPMLEAYAKLHPFTELIPTSVRKQENVPPLLAVLANLLPEGPHGYDQDTLTNRPVVFFVREYIREAILNQLSREVPHAIAVSIDQADETPTLLRISATIHVEKRGQRKIVVGRGGERIKELGTAARERIEKLVEKQVHLQLFVRVTAEWKDTPRQLAELGYEVGQTVPQAPESPEANPTETSKGNP